MVERMVEIFNEHDADVPLFLYFAPQNPHDPSQPKEEFLRPYLDSQYTDKRKKYLGT
jgi:hypothetical protein